MGARGKSITNSYSESFLIGNIIVSLVPWLHLHLICNFFIVNKAEGPGDKATLCHWPLVSLWAEDVNQKNIWNYVTQLD